MFAAVNVWDEILKWAIPFACVGIVAIIRQVATAVRHVREVGAQIEQLHDYTRYHLGPNGASPALHARIANLEHCATPGCTVRPTAPPTPPVTPPGV